MSGFDSSMKTSGSLKMKVLLILTVFCEFLAVTEGLVSIYWGLPDTACVVGKLFVYKIPHDAFKGEIKNFEVSEATGSGELPDWLSWNGLERKFLGVPGVEDLGPHYLSVKAIGMNSTHMSVAKDVFTIYVREETHLSGRKVQTLEDKKQPGRGEMRCSEEESVISLAVLLDVDLHRMRAEDRKNILESAATDLNLPIERLRLYSWDYAASLKPDLLLAGPGEANAQGDQHSSKGTYLTWKIGCGQAATGLEASVGNLEHKVIKGELSAALGYRIMSWQVMSSKMGPRKRRRIDNRYATATPVVTAAPRTRTPEIVVRPVLTTVIRTHTPEVTPEPSRVTERTTTERSTSRKHYDYPPEVVNAMERLRCQVGVLCQHKVRKDTFLDREEGNTFQLRLSLEPIAGGSSECFLSKSKRHLTCFTLEGGTKGYRLTAKDKSDQTASVAFQVDTARDSQEDSKPSHSVTIRLDKDFDEFSRNVTEMAHFLKRLGKFFEDDSANLVKILAIYGGSTVVEWTNSSLPKEYCPEQRIKKMEKRLETKAFVAHMGPAFPILGTSVEMTGACVKMDPPPPPPGKETPEEPTKGRGEKDETPAPVTSDDNVLISTVIPIVIIVVLLVVAILIACILWRRNKKRKAGKDEAKNEFVSKGAPVIFPDEVDPLTGKEPTAATPMLIKEERPPLPIAPPQPPAHQHETAQYQNGRGSAPREETMEMKERAPLMSSQVTEHENPMYKPPPPIELSNTRSPRPKHTLPHQRQPPPYVPP